LARGQLARGLALFGARCGRHDDRELVEQPPGEQGVVVHGVNATKKKNGRRFHGVLEKLKPAGTRTWKPLFFF
jgi:hypothetical protein